MRLLKMCAWAAACLGCVMLTLPARASDHLTVKTDKGKVRGKLSADGQVRIFLGIPYAAPPVGELRWQPPQPAAKWQGERDATNWGNRCIQTHPFEDMVYRDPGQSEDCLNLNVWAPAKGKHGKLPVMVWIYGGGFTAGTTSEPRQDGTHLAQKGVIVVSMNYRLGIFGFLVTPELAAESPQHAAGNYGLMDQTAALRWVQKNIARFGGDPKNVTIFGESAGSLSVAAQMASPLAQGLFARAIGESGGIFTRPRDEFQSLTDREKTDPEFAREVLGTSDLGRLRAMSWQDILAKLQAHEGRAPFWPNVDGWFLPEDAAQIYAEGKQAHVPLLAGWNRDEPSAQVIDYPTPVTPQSFEAMAQQEFGPRAGEFLKLFPANTPEETDRSAIDLAGAKFITFSTWAWLEAQLKTGDAPVYHYYFRRPSPESQFHPAGSGAFHSDEIEYVFGTLDSRPGAHWEPADYALSDLMQTYWTNFAKTGDPNGAGSPQWPQYDAADGYETMNLDATSEAKPAAHRDRWLFLQSVWAGKGQE
ncbi:MAG: carboxylesterase/lipase family protein [Acidobacteriaceae bacterium]